MNQDEPQKKKALSEIGHLFLSSVRQRHTNGAPNPRRKPPTGSRSQSIDMTSEEFAQAMARGELTPHAAGRVPQISAVIGAHLNGRHIDRAHELARYLADHGQRVAALELDASEFRLTCFGAADEKGPEDASPTEAFDARQMAEALEELNWDIDQWLLLLPTPRVLEARQLLKLVDHWVLLSTCDHDGVVGAYRMLKGLADVHHPRLSLALLDAPDEAQARRVYSKLAGVCDQFLGWTIEEEIVVEKVEDATETVVMCCRPTRDKAALAQGPHWQVVADFLAKAKLAAAHAAEAALDVGRPQPAEQPADRGEPSTSPVAVEPEPELEPRRVADVVLPTLCGPSQTPRPDEPHPRPVTTAAVCQTTGVDDVVDLPSLDASAAMILESVLRREGNQIVECPVRPPMCADARLGVTRERRLVLLAVAHQGLVGLPGIGQAYRWLTENRALVAMALPQLAIDAHAMPALRLFVDHADLRADALQPMLAAGQVSVQAYRKLRWGDRTGLLLDAA